ncbi:hypothetical protein GCM10027020_04370 [Nocardioides salsibiostraticola]
MLRRRHSLRTPFAAVVAFLMMGAFALVSVTTTPGASAQTSSAPLTAQLAAKKGKFVREPGFRMKVATFNVLGSQHTAGSRRASGVKRVRATARIIKQNKIDVIAMQEVQMDQLNVLGKRLNKYRIFPYKKFGKSQGLRLQIAYKNSKYKRVNQGKIITAFHGQRRPIPWVKLRERETGRTFFYMSIHNSPKGAEGERDSATRRQINLINALRKSGDPVFLGADANEFTEFNCRVGRSTRTVSAAGGRLHPRCTSPRRPIFDKVMGSRYVEFKRYRRSDSKRVRFASDHYFVSAVAKVPPTKP